MATSWSGSEISLDERWLLGSLVEMQAATHGRHGGWASVFALLWVFTSVPVAAGAEEKINPIRIDGKVFTTRSALLAHAREKAEKEVEKVERGYFYGDSLMISLPPDGMILTPSFLGITPHASEDARSYVLNLFKMDAELLGLAFTRAGLFDSVALKQSSSYVRQASDLGYRYVLNYRKAFEMVWVDTTTGKEILLWEKTAENKGATNLAELLHKVERLLEQTQIASRQQSGSKKQAVLAEAPIEGMQYDEATRKGWVSVKGRGLEARGLVLRRIAEICATKNKLLISDEMQARGAFKVLDEELKDGVLKISFEALY